MDRPRDEPGSPDDGQRRGSADERWREALQNLRALDRHPAPTAPAPAAKPAPPPAEIDATLAALQVLARRYHAEASAPPPAPEDDPFPRRSASPHAAAYAAAAHAAAAEPDDPPAWAANDDMPYGGLRKRARWTSTALIVGSAALLSVLLVGALSLSRQMFHSAPPAVPARQIAAPAADVETAKRVPAGEGRLDLPAIEKAMAECDDEAARRPDALYFLILPVESPIRNYQPWIMSSVGEIGSSVILLRSKDTLDGLREGSLTLYRGSYTFSIIDAASDATHSWGKSTGVARFAKLDAAQVAGFRVRFGFADFVGDTPSNFRFPRQKGVCYWVSALLRS